MNQKELKKSVLDYDIVLRLHISSKIFSIILPSEAFAFALYLYFIFLTPEFCFEYFFVINLLILRFKFVVKSSVGEG